jgi:hypothetical protein
MMTRKIKKAGSRTLQGAREALALARGRADSSAYGIHPPSKRRRRKSSTQLTVRQQHELAALAALPDKRIDTDDIPEVQDWVGAKRGLFHRSSKT